MHCKKHAKVNIVLNGIYKNRNKINKLAKFLFESLLEDEDLIFRLTKKREV